MGELKKVRIGDTENVITGEGGGGGVAMESITYANLLAKRNDGTLTPGQQYRITDYVCTTTQEESRAVSHPFDIIVTADDESTLNENARACMRDGDTYYYPDENVEPQTIYNGSFTIGSEEIEGFPATELDLNWPECDDDIALPPYINVKYDGTDYQIPFDTYGYGEFRDGYPYFGNFPVYIQSGVTIVTAVGSSGTHTLKISGVFTCNAYRSVLETWELKYCIDNDRSRFSWADGANGKGVIYWLRDEKGNEAPYDFKQIQFARYRVLESDTTALEGAYLPFDYIYDGTISVSSTPVWFYTFSAVFTDAEDPDVIESIEDASVIHGTVYDNVIKPLLVDQAGDIPK